MGRSLASSCVILLALALCSVWAAVSGTELPEPDPEMGVIAVTVGAKPAMGPKQPAIQVQFVRVEEDTDILVAESLIRSNYYRKKQVFLLNAKPGRYVAVACRIEGAEHWAFLDASSIRQTEIEVEAGRVGFMGEITLKGNPKIKTADSAQSHYMRLIAPEEAGMGFLKRTFNHTYLSLATLIAIERGQETWAEFQDLAERKSLRDHPEWVAMVAGTRKP